MSMGHSRRCYRILPCYINKRRRQAIRNFRIYFIYVFIKLQKQLRQQRSTHTSCLTDILAKESSVLTQNLETQVTSLMPSFTTKITVHLSANIPLMLNVDANCQCLFVIRKLGENYHECPRDLDSDLKHSHLHQRDKRKGGQFAASPH